MASIKGQILSSKSEIPQANILVTITTSTVPHPDMAAQSNEAGYYTLSGLQAGIYVLQAGTTQSIVEIDSDDAEVGCEFLIEANTNAKVLTTCSSKQQTHISEVPNFTKATHPEAIDTVKVVSSLSTEQLPNINCSSQVGEADDRPPDLEPVEENFESDPYQRDIDLIETQENAPVSISLAEKALVYTILSLNIAQGVKDVDELTDKAWRTLNPTEDFPISTGDPDYARKSAEWFYLRNEIVRPLIKNTGSGSASKPADSDSLDLVSVRMPKGTTHRLSANNLKYGLQETIDALIAIAADWHRRHPDVDLMIRDISKQNGGSLQPPHSSHRCGLDCDLQLWVGKNKVCMKHPRYPEWRPLIQELVDIVRSNSVLPVKAIGFSDRQIKNVSHWGGHTCHAHVRFCAPASKIDQIEEFLSQEYADKPRNKRPKYRC